VDLIAGGELSEEESGRLDAAGESCCHGGCGEDVSATAVVDMVGSMGTFLASSAGSTGEAWAGEEDEGGEGRREAAESSFVCDRDADRCGC